MTTRSETRQAWEPLALPAEAQDFVYASGAGFESQDPATLHTTARLRTSTATDIDNAVSAARSALARRAWSTDGPRRARVLHAFADSMVADRHRLGELLTREQGQPLRDAVDEIERAAGMVDFYAGLARAVYGRAAVLGPSANGVLLREPVGVVAVITPWNMPATLLARSLAPALAAGNSCVVKPASWTSAVTVELLALLARQDELPDGVVSCVLGGGSVVGDALVGHAGVDMIAFTGDTSTGSAVMRRASEGLKKVALELGGKSPNMVFADADLDAAVPAAVKSAFKNSGQVCTAASRLMVEDSVADQVIEQAAKIVLALRVGDGLQPTSELGPVVSPAQQETINGYLTVGSRDGTVAAEATIPDSPGCFVRPSIITDLPEGSKLLREEIFGPVITVQRFADEDQAIALANDTEYGLAAGLWTNNLNRAWRVGAAVQAGTIWINTYHRFYPEMEVGGYKHSGIGRQLGLEGLHEFTQTKHLNFQGA